jgi:DNA-binding HxlR family transcriptional regulator
VLDARLTVGCGALTPQPNAIGSSLGLLGDEWSLLIVRGAFEGARRYGDWKARLPISDAVLTARLGTLLTADVLQRVAATDGTGREEYVLTAAGLDLWQLLLCIWAWELQHVPGQADRLPRMVHATCGRPFHPVLRCGHCGAAAAADDVDARFGPSGSFARSAPVGSNRRRQISGRTELGPAGNGPSMFADTMALIGNRWSSAVLGAAFLGARRFRDFEQIGAPPTVVADRLRTFVELGVLAPTGGEHGEPAAYALTAKGSALFPVIVSFLVWGERWRPADDGPAVLATHRACGAGFVPQLACSECDDTVQLTSLDIRDVHAATTR